MKICVVKKVNHKNKKANMATVELKDIIIFIVIVGVIIGIIILFKNSTDRSVETGCGAYGYTYCHKGSSCPDGSIHISKQDVDCKKGLDKNYVCCAGEEPE